MTEVARGLLRPASDAPAVGEWSEDLVRLGGLVAGDWVLLAAHVRHRLVQTVPGTSWLAVHAIS